MANEFASGSRKPFEVIYEDSGQLAPFGRVRMATSVTLFDADNEYDVGPLLWEDVVTGGATVVHLPNENSVRLRCATASGDKVVRQSRAYFRYQPGKGQTIRLTGLFGATVANLRKRVGYFDASNGLFLEQISTGFSFVRRTKTSGSVVDNAVAQASWNVDKLDGTGPSGITLDATKAFHLVIDFEWLGVGRARMGFEMGTGTVVWAHYFISPNVLTTVYMTTPNLPIRYEIENLAAQGGNNDFIAICAMVASEEGLETERGFPFSAGNGITAISVTTRLPILSIRPKATFNSIVNRGRIDPESVNVNIASGSALVEVVYNGTLTDASFSSVDASSITEFDIAATAISGGITTYSFTLSGGIAATQGDLISAFLSRLPLTLDQAGTNPIPLSIVVTAFTGTVAAGAQFNWREIR